MYLWSNGVQPDLFTMDPDCSYLTQVTDAPQTEIVPNRGTYPPATSAIDGPAPAAALTRSSHRCPSDVDRAL